MPTYQYACTACGHSFEAFQSFHEDALTHCPECDGRLRKVFNAVGVVFKGSGFYRTDSRSGSTASVPAASSSSSEKSDSGKSDSGKSDSGKSDSRKSDSGGGSGATPSSTVAAG